MHTRVDLASFAHDVRALAVQAHRALRDPTRSPGELTVLLARAGQLSAQSGNAGVSRWLESVQARLARELRGHPAA